VYVRIIVRTSINSLNGDTVLKNKILSAFFATTLIAGSLVAGAPAAATGPLQLTASSTAADFRAGGLGDVATGPNVLVFSLAPFTDPSEEDLIISQSLVSIASYIKWTDAADGWAALLADVDTLVFPELNGQSFWTGRFTSAARTDIKNWVTAGGLIVGTGSYTHQDILTDLLGESFTMSDSYWNDWDLQVQSATLPATLPVGNYTGGIEDFSQLPSGIRSKAQLIYYDEANDNAGVVNFRVGSGFYVYNAYDWFPDFGEVATVRAAWNLTLGLIVAGESVAAANETSAPAQYTGPIVAPTAGVIVATAGSSVVVPGSRLSGVTKVMVAGLDAQVVVRSDGQLEIVVPRGLAPGLYDLVIVSDSGTLTVQAAIRVTAGSASGGAVGEARPSTKMIGANKLKVWVFEPYGVGKVQIKFNGREIAWVNALSADDPKLRDGYLVRTLTLAAGKNVVEVYVDGERVSRRVATGS